jgi:hypothetical protein
MTNAVFAVFKTKEQADKALIGLRREGFSSSQISTLAPETGGSKDFAHESRTHLPEGAVFGALVGLLIFSLTGIVAGFHDVGIPFGETNLTIHPLVGGIVGALFGAAFGAAAGGLIGVGTPPTAAERYAEYLDEGGILVSVHTEDPDRAQLAVTVLENSEGSDPVIIDEEQTWKWIMEYSRRGRSRSMHPAHPAG